MVLFATDIAARGLDFPTIDWVVQVRSGAVWYVVCGRVAVGGGWVARCLRQALKPFKLGTVQPSISPCPHCCCLVPPCSGRAPQADCPEDTAAYIHRVGRTARYVSSGKGLLLLLPSEREGMLAQVGRRCCWLSAPSRLPALAFS